MNYGRFPATIEDCHLGAWAGPEPTTNIRDDLYETAIGPGDGHPVREYFPSNAEYGSVVVEDAINFILAA
jgi:hypothetical protein